MKAMKLVGVLIALVLVVVVGVGVYLFDNLNAIIKETVETVGPVVTETDVNLNEVDVKIQNGRGELNHFVVGNPKGFTSPHFFKSDQIVLHIDPESVTKDVKVIKEIRIEGVNITAEQKGLNTNIQELMKTLQKGASASSSKASSTSGNSEGTDVRLMLEKLVFTKGSMSLVTEKYGSYDLELPEVNVSNIGDTKTGLTPEELAREILTPLLKQAKKSVERRLREVAKGELSKKLGADVDAKIEEGKEKLAEKKEELKAKRDEAKDKLKKEAEEKLGEDAEKKLKDLKNLFGN